jgi:hypothetical protein
MTKTTEARYREDRDEDFRVSYDDQPNEIVDEIGCALEQHGLSIVDDGKSHEGFILYQIVPIKECGPSEPSNTHEPIGERTRVAFEAFRAEVKRLVLAQRPPHLPQERSVLIDAAASLARAIATDVVESMPSDLLR